MGRKSEFSDQLRRHLAKKNKRNSLRVIGDATGIHPSNLQRFLKDKRNLGLPSIDRLVKYLNLKVVLR